MWLLAYASLAMAASSNKHVTSRLLGCGGVLRLVSRVSKEGMDEQVARRSRSMIAPRSGSAFRLQSRVERSHHRRMTGRSSSKQCSNASKRLGVCRGRRGNRVPGRAARMHAAAAKAPLRLRFVPAAPQRTDEH